MMRASLCTCALLMALATPVIADTPLPAPGMSMQAVEARFGAPVSKGAPVGRPPITRWEYGDFVVVFERSSVVSSVRVVRGGSSASPASQGTPAAATAAKPQAAAPASQAPAAPPSGTRATVTVTVKPVEAPSTPAVPASEGAEDGATVQEAMDRAAAEKEAESAPATPEPASAAPADPGFSFDPETGRIIVK